MNNNIPTSIKEFAESAELYDICEDIGKSFNLLIDQIGELDSEVRGVLLGINKSTDFTDHITKRLEIDENLARQITKQINEKVFKAMRENLQTDTSSDKSFISPIERTGNFTIEKENGYSNHFMSKSVNPNDKEKILSSIEDKIHRPDLENEEKETFTEPLVDHLISSSTARSEEKIIHKEIPPVPVNLPTENNVIEKTPVPSAPPKPKGPDLYREPV